MATASRPASLIELDSVPPSPDEEPDVDAGGDGDEGGTDLCERCRQFDIQSFGRSGSRTRGYMLRDVQAAATASGDGDGCAFCSLLLDSVRDVERPRDVTEMERNMLRLTVNNDPDMYVHMTLSGDYKNPDPQSLVPPVPGLGANRLRTAIADRFSEVKNASDHELCLAAEEDSPAAQNGDIIGRYLGREPGSKIHFDTVRGWIEMCSTHPKCNQTVSGDVDIHSRHSPLPARCIKIIPTGGDPSLRTRLVSTEGQKGTYITLTHRWNVGTERCKTTVANYSERQEEVNWETLPRLFQDVLTIAAKLEVQYVWIDSICIIQEGDDGADWLREAPKMAQYYQFSYLTIAGTMSNTTNGLLCAYPDEYAPWGSQLVRMPYRNKTCVQTGHFFVYKRRVPAAEDYWTTVRESILLRRGWVLQEWLLSKRLLWYTSKGLFFECHTGVMRTEYRETIWVENAKPDLQSRLRLKGSFHFGSPSILDFWYRALELYSSCHLTKPGQDRILAVAGIAKETGLILANKVRRKAVVDGVHHKVYEVYVAGLWLRDLHHGLIWEEDHSAPPCTTKVDQAPSWSWASLMTPVKWAERDEGTKKKLKVTGLCLRRRDGHDHQPDYVIEKGWMTRRLESTNGGIGERARFDETNMFACLHTRGKVRTVHVRGYLETESYLETAATATAYGKNPMSPCQWRALCTPASPDVIAGWGSAERLRNGNEATICTDAGIAVHALHVSTRFARSGMLIKDHDPVLDVLLLEETGFESHTFRRLGVGRIFDMSLIREFETTSERDIQFV